MSAQNPEPIGYWFCPLFLFDSSGENIELVEGTRIEKLEHLPATIRDYIRSLIGMEFLKMGIVHRAHWAIWLPHTEKLGPITSTPPHFREDKVEHVFINLTTAFRLCHSGMVTPGDIVFVSPPPHDLGIIACSLGSYISRRYDISAIEPYVLRESDVSVAKCLVQEIAKWRKSYSALDIAIRRFNLSYSSDFEDRIVDHMIAFESLYLGHDLELKYRLALRLAFLLGSDDGEREIIFRDMKEAYDTRSDIVHGNKKIETDQLQRIIPTTEEYLRQSIRKFLSLLSEGHSLNSLKGVKKRADKKLAELDKNILSNGTLLSADNPNTE